MSREKESIVSKGYQSCQNMGTRTPMANHHFSCTHIFCRIGLRLLASCSPYPIPEHLDHVHGRWIIHGCLELPHGRHDPSAVDEITDEVVDAGRAGQVGQGAHLQLGQEPVKHALHHITQFVLGCVKFTTALWRLHATYMKSPVPVEARDDLRPRPLDLLVPPVGVDAVRQDEGAEGLREDEQVPLHDGRHDADEERLEVLGHRVLLHHGLGQDLGGVRRQVVDGAEGEQGRYVFLDLIYSG